MSNNYFFELFKLYGLGKQGEVSSENQDQYYSMIMMIHLLLTSPFDDNTTLHLLYILDIFWDYDQSSEGERRLFEGRKLFQETYFAESGIPTFRLGGEKSDNLVLGGGGITESGHPIMPATYTGITEAPILLFDLMEKKKSLRAVYYYMTQWMLEKALSGDILANILHKSILQQNEESEVAKDMKGLDDDSATIGPQKLNRLICVELLSIILLPILSATRYGMTARPVTDFPLFLFYNDNTATTEYPFTNISDIKEPQELEPAMVPSLVLSSDSTNLFRSYKNRFTFQPYSYHYPEFKGCHKLKNISHKTFGYLLFGLIEKVVEILNERKIDANRSILINIIEYLMEFPCIFHEYASLYGWRQDPSLYSTIYTDIINKYCQTVMNTSQALLDVCFMVIFSQGQIVVTDDVEIDLMDDGDDELTLFKSAQEIASKLSEEDEQYFMEFFSKFVDLTAQHDRIESGLLAALGMCNLSPNDFLYQSLSLAITNGCDAGSVRSPIDIFSDSYHYMHSDVVYLFLTGLEYVVFLLRAISHYAPSVGPEDPEIYRDMYMLLDREKVLKTIFEAFSIQLDTTSFMEFLRKMLDSISSARSKTKKDRILSMAPSFLLSAITEIDTMYQRRTENHIPVTGELLQQFAQDLQFTTSDVFLEKPQTPLLAFTSNPTDDCTEASSSRDVEKKTANETKADTGKRQTVLEIINEKADFLRRVFETFLDKDPSSIDRLWSEGRYAKQVALFESKYDILYRMLQDIYSYSSQTYKDMALVMDEYRLPAYQQLETRSSMIKRGYIGGVYRNSSEWYVIQLVRNYIMIPEVRSSLKYVAKITLVSKGILSLHLNNAEESSDAAPSLQDLAKCRGICSPNRYGMTLFFSKEKDGSLVLVSAHSVLYFTDSVLIALMTDKDSDFISSHIDKLIVFASPIEHAISRSLFGDFVPDVGSSEMICNGRSYCSLDTCKYCRTRGAIVHGRNKGQNSIKDVRQLMTPMVDFHNILLRRIAQEGDDRDASVFQFRNIILNKLCTIDTNIISAFQSSNQLCISKKSSGKTGIVSFALSDNKVYDTSELSSLKSDQDVRSIYSEERYVKITFQKKGIARISKAICECVEDTLFKDKIDKSTFADSTLQAELKAAFDDCMAGHKPPLILDPVSPSLWILADSPNFFAVHYSELSYELLRTVESLGAELKCVTQVFDGIGGRKRFLIRAFHAILPIIDPDFGKILLDVLNEKIIAAGVSNGKQATTARLIDGTWKFIYLVEQSTDDMYADKKLSERTVKLIKELNPSLAAALASKSQPVSESSPAKEPEKTTEPNSFLNGNENLDYLMTKLKPFISQIISRIPVKFMTVGQFNELDCPATMDDLIIIVKSSDCNIDDTRRLLPRSIRTVELVLDEK